MIHVTHSTVSAVPGMHRNIPGTQPRAHHLDLGLDLECPEHCGERLDPVLALVEDDFGVPTLTVVVRIERDRVCHAVQGEITFDARPGAVAHHLYRTKLDLRVLARLERFLGVFLDVPAVGVGDVVDHPQRGRVEIRGETVVLAHVHGEIRHPEGRIVTEGGCHSVDKDIYPAVHGGRIESRHAVSVAGRHTNGHG